MLRDGLIVYALGWIFLCQPFSIPSSSMRSSLLPGDYVLVSKYAYGYSRFSLPLAPNLFSGRIFAATPQRGDVVVFRLPKDDALYYIKRVIGLPGDRVQMIDNRLHINGEPVSRERIGEAQEPDAAGRPQRVTSWRETLPNGVSYTTLDMVENGFYDDTPPYVVPAGHYFMMGDNRDNSTDSRVLSAVGYVPFENLVGRAGLVFFSMLEGERPWRLWRWPWAVRWDRLFASVR